MNAAALGLLALSLLAIAGSLAFLLRGLLARAPGPLSLRVTTRSAHGDEIFRLRLARPLWLRWLPLPRFAPGQYVQIAAPGGEGRRAYSLARWQALPFAYEVAIRREARGKVSPALHRDARPGRRLQIGRPAGHFSPHISARGRDALLIAGGIGITPLLAMLDAWRAGRLPHWGKVRLVWQVRFEHEWLYRAELEALVREHPAFSLHLLASRPRLGPPQRLDAALLAALLPQPGHSEAWLCAGSGLLDAACAQLRELGLQEEQIHFERFSAAAAGSTGRWPLMLDGQTIAFDEHRSVLDAFDAAGIKLDADCRGGSCGRCAVKLDFGHTRASLAPEFTAPEGQILACCHVPESPLVLSRV